MSCDLRQVSREQGKRGRRVVGIVGGASCTDCAAVLACVTRRCAAVAALSCGVAVGAGATGGSSE